MKRSLSIRFQPSYEKAAGAPKFTGAAADLLGCLATPEASHAALVALEPAPSTPAEPGARRAFLVELLKAAAEAANLGEAEMALRGYAAAFAISRSSPLLLLAANMFLKLGSEASLAAAEQTYEALMDVSGLSADQKAVLPLKLEAVRTARERLAAGEDLETPRLSRRVSIRHQLLDRSVLEQLQSPANPGTTPDPRELAPEAAPGALAADTRSPSGRSLTSPTTFVAHSRPRRVTGDL